ncbi:MAG: DUF559 domain-containing protein [Solirubrobacteraceae bacterium]
MSREQLRELGFSDEQVERRLEHSRLQRVYPRVYAVGHRRLVPHAHLLAALLSAGPRAFISHRTAAAVWGLRQAIDVRRIELTVPSGGGRRRATGFTVHRCTREPEPADLRVRDGLRVSAVPRLLVELASRERPAELGRLITVAVRKRLLRLDQADGLQQLEEALRRHRRRAGMAKLEQALSGYTRPDSSRSGLERAFDDMLRRHPEIPEPQRNVRLDVWEIDRLWPEHRLAVELDGRPYHVAVVDMERDRVKDAALQKLGLIPLRFTDFRMEHDQAGVLADLRHFLGLSR